MPSHTTDTLLAALHDGACYPHPTCNIRAIHTHISTIFLTGEFAYKIKKPVNFGFLDFTHLADRKHFCEEELRLNGRLAPQLYLAAVPIYQASDGTYHLAPDSLTIPANTAEVVEYAVKMRQFDSAQQLDCLLANNTLPVTVMDALATQIAHFHQHIAVAADTSHFGLPATVMHPMQQNFEHLRACLQHLPHNLPQPQRLECLSLLEKWTQQEYLRLYSTLLTRKQAGHVRACHGDMHVGNIALLGTEITIFDGIEFNDELRWIDTISEMAFLVMDLEDRHAPTHAHRVLNTYLSITGDYAALNLLKFYKVYRAMVRAKVNALRLSQLHDDPNAQAEVLAHCDSYLQLAMQYTQPTTPALILTHGLSGSGKSFGCRQLVDALGWIQIRSDVERKRLATPTAEQVSNAVSAPDPLYNQSMTAKTYARLAELAQQLLTDGYSVVVDATFLEAAKRQQFQQIAQTLRLPFLILHFVGTPEQLADNIQQRLLQGNDASDANWEVLQQQLQHYKPLQDDEPCVTVPCYGQIPIIAIQARLESS
ncbi:MAG: hypothetical protein RI964_425 [Pseudomonadota bacterium]|jgi:aminoglycoside phosphotransferase family enzyme/predicted kinase